MSGPDPELVDERLTGLASWLLHREDFDRAEAILELADQLRPGGFRRRMTQARLLVLQGAAGEAVFQLKAALELDPFDEDACELLGNLQESLDRPEEAAEALADALLCAGTINPELVEEYRGRLEELLEKAGRAGTREELVALRATRFEELARAAEAAAAAAAAPARSDAPSAAPAEGPQDPDVPQASSAALLHGAGLFPGLTEDELEPLEGAVARVEVAAGQAVFAEGDPSEDIFVVESGRVEISRNTPFGAQALAHCETGSVFGEMNFIDGRPRSADAVAESDARMLRIAHRALKEVFEAEPKLALAFLREFWRGLADKVREANELMKSFFADESATPAGTPPDGAAAEPGSDGREEGVDESEKADVLTEQGLTGDELRRLAALAEARSFEIEQPMFREGDAGDSLYIVLSGEVRISKQIPGVGEEALAILKRGDFFGEMALIDGETRSASAKAHATDTRVLRISKERLDELIATGGSGAIEFLSILCRLLSGRLREINDKIVQWKYMSGGF